MEDRFVGERRLRKAGHYRDMARNMRELAEQEADKEVRKAMMELAENYDQLCHQLIERTDTEKTCEVAVHLEKVVPRERFR